MKPLHLFIAFVSFMAGIVGTAFVLKNDISRPAVETVAPKNVPCQQ